jgi:protein-tyrosine kinase
MSEFFKALEQAERDRVRQDQAEAASAPPAARTSPPEKVRREAPTREVTTREVATREVSARENGTAVSEPPVIKPAPVKPLADKPAVAKHVNSSPVAPPPIVAKPSRPAPSEAPSPSSVFRPSLGTPERSRFGGRVAGRQPMLVAQTDPNSIEANAYRTVRANIELMADDRAFRHIAITSAGGGDGKSTTAANLAVVAAQGGRRVCLVDADVRRPTLHEVFGLPNVDGLTLALTHGKPLHTVAKAADIDNLSIVVAGRGADEAVHDLLTAARLEKILQESEAAYDLVIFDSPPVTAVADALSVAAVCDGVILVVRPGTISSSVLRRTIGQVKQVKGRVLGVLLNQVDLRVVDADSYGYYRKNRAKV